MNMMYNNENNNYFNIFFLEVADFFFSVNVGFLDIRY